ELTQPVVGRPAHATLPALLGPSLVGSCSTTTVWRHGYGSVCVIVRQSSSTARWKAKEGALLPCETMALQRTLWGPIFFANQPTSPLSSFSPTSERNAFSSTERLS